MRSLNVANIFRVFIVVSIFGAAEKLPAQKVKNADFQTQSPVFYQPKLVVGIVIDQMRYEYLTRFYTRYGEGGFKRLVTDGFNCKNNHFNYIPTYTGPGHASIYTGTTPQNHGIISNNWYDKFGKEVVYCASDTTVVSIGCSSLSERMSPRRMKTTTVGDQKSIAYANARKDYWYFAKGPWCDSPGRSYCKCCLLVPRKGYGCLDYE